MNIPVVAIITPTKNRLKLLCETMDSVQKQSFDAWEHLIVDDGSNDGTMEEVTSRSKTDPRIRYIQREGDKAGANVCRNIGIRESRADLIIFLDSDDLLEPECLLRRVEIMRRNNDLDFAVFRAGIFVKSVGDLRRLYHPQNPGDDLSRFLTLECVWEISGPVWRRNFIEKIGCFDETLMSMQDLELHVRALCDRGRYVCFSDVDHHIRWGDSHNTSVRHFNDPVYITSAEHTPDKLLSKVSTSGLLTWTRRRAITGLSFRVAECWARIGKLNRAIQVWNRACRQQQAPEYLQIIGALMLSAAWLGRKSEYTLCFRLVNKWKGWVRFRPELELVKQAKKLSYDSK